MAESDAIREKRRAKFLEKLEKKNSSQTFQKNTEDSDIYNNTNSNASNLTKKETLANINITDINASEERVDNNNFPSKGKAPMNEPDSMNYKDIYNLQKKYEQVSYTQSYLRFIISIILGVLHFYNNFSDSLHIITLFLILQTSLFYYNRYIDNEKKLLLAKINTGQKGSSSQLVDEKQIMDLLGVVEKTIRVFKMPINVLSDISAFFFTNILCFYLYTKSKF